MAQRKTTKFQKTVLTILVMVLSLGLLLPYIMDGRQIQAGNEYDSYRLYSKRKNG